DWGPGSHPRYSGDRRRAQPRGGRTFGLAIRTTADRPTPRPRRTLLAGERIELEGEQVIRPGRVVAVRPLGHAAEWQAGAAVVVATTAPAALSRSTPRPTHRFGDRTAERREVRVRDPGPPE